MPFYGGAGLASTGLANQVAFHSADTVVAGDVDFTFDGVDAVLRGKLDLGKPGTGAGLDIGEGGSYSTDAAGTTIVKSFSYDASAASGSRFAALTITSNNTLLGDAGDRLYIGSTSKFWAIRCAIGIAKTSETLLCFYWNGSALTACTFMGILKDSVTALGTAIFEQTSEQEYVTFDKAIDADWVTADNQLDAIPNGAASLFWICLQVPAGGLATPPRIDDIKVRGTDVDFATGTSQLIYWGKARVEVHEKIFAFVDRAAAQPTITDTVFSANTSISTFTLRNNQSDAVDFSWKLPQGLDTSSKIQITLDWFTDNSGQIDMDLHYKLATQGTVIGVAQADTASINTLITPSAADALQTNDILTANLIDISSMAVDDIIIFTLVRDGSSDTNSGDVFPISVSIHHVLWTAGEHV